MRNTKRIGIYFVLNRDVYNKMTVDKTRIMNAMADEIRPEDLEQIAGILCRTPDEYPPAACSRTTWNPFWRSIFIELQAVFPQKRSCKKPKIPKFSTIKLRRRFS